MPLPVDRLRAAALAQLTPGELRSCVVYLATSPISRGGTLTFPRIKFTCPWDGHLAFVDLEPMANWGHSCCYICINWETGEALRLAAQFPPFGPRRDDQSKEHWQVLYQAPGVPDGLLAVPKR